MRTQNKNLFLRAVPITGRGLTLAGRLTVPTLIWFASLAIGLGAERFVPQGGLLNYSNIQAAINASSRGDIIRVQPGTYRESITFRSADITLTSMDPNDWNVVQATIIQGNSNRSVVSFATGQTTNTLFTGFTVRGGGGTIYLGFLLLGGGLYCNQSSPSIIRNIIEENQLSLTRFDVNTQGGAIACLNSTARISRNIIRNNWAQYGAAIISVFGGSPLIQDNLIYKNIGYGGAVYLADQGKFLNNTLVENPFAGLNVDQTGLVANNIIASFQSVGLLANGTPESLSWFRYNEIWEPGGTEIQLNTPDGLIQTSVAGRNGNISVDPLFVNSTNLDFRLSASSACINAGDLLGLRSTNELDLDGSARVFALRVDMGASEFSGARNFPPIANAGADQNVAGWIGGKVLLDGAGSVDPEGATLSFTWKQISGPPVGLSATNAQAVFTPNALGEYQFDLAVSDGVNESTHDSVRIVVTNLPPIASAGEGQSLGAVPESLTLNGSHSFDPEGQTLVYRWRQTSGPAVQCSNAESPRPTVKPAGPGNYEFELTVSDAFNTSKPDTVRFYLGQVPPVANAGLTRYAGPSPITLDGSASFAPNNPAPLEYAWTLISGPALTLAPTNVANPTVSNFVQVATNREAIFELVVSAGGMTSPPSRVKVVFVRAWGDSSFLLLSTPFKTNQPSVVAFGGGNCISGTTSSPGSRWYGMANVFTIEYSSDPNSPMYEPTYLSYGDQLIVLLSSLAPAYDQPIQTMGYSTGGMPACDVARRLNIDYRDPHYLVNRVTLLDAACRDYDPGIGDLLSNRVPGKTFWIDNYYSTGLYHSGTLNVQFPTPPADHGTPPIWYNQSWVPGSPYDPTNFNNGVYAGAFFSMVGPGKNYQLETTQSEYFFGWNATNRFLAGTLVQENPLVYPARLPGVVEITGPTNGILANEGSVVLSCKPVVNAAKYEILVGRDSHEVTQVAWEGSTPPDRPLRSLPFLKTWWTLRATDAWGTTSWSDPRYIVRANSTPVADASATQPRVVVPLNCSPTIVLDGSRSWDPDNDALHYFWFQSGAASAFATGTVAVTTLPMGISTLILAVDDGVATNTQIFQVEMFTPARVAEDLIDLVNLQADKPDPLVASLQAAVNSIGRQQANSAINQLQAFEHKVRAQVEGLDSALGESLIRKAEELMQVLGHDCSSARPRGRIGKVSHSRGRAHLEFSAPSGFTYMIETSTNLIDWEKIGVASEFGLGEFQFEEANVAQTPTRFYRVVVP